MRKYPRTVLALILLLLVTHAIDAAPRNRRRARRIARRNVARQTTRTYTYSNQPNVRNYTITSVAESTAPPTSTTRPTEPTAHASEEAANIAPSLIVTSTESVSSPSDEVARTLGEGDFLPTDPAASRIQSETSHTTLLATASSSTDVSERVVVNRPVVTEQATRQPVRVVQQSTRAVANSALAEVNAIRSRRGLHAFIEDPNLTAVAYRKASIQANRGAVGHPGGSMGGARYEGVGMGHQFTTCYLYSSGPRYAGAATVTGANGQRYHCLLLR